MSENVLFMTLAGSAVVHFVITCVMGLFARHRVQYLCLAWVNGIFFCTLLGASFFSHDIAVGEPGILHPAMLLAVLCACYLQSIYPLNISMPGICSGSACGATHGPYWCSSASISSQR